MPTTRKKVIKTVYKDDEESDQGGDFSDSGSEAVITEQSSSDEDQHSSDDDFITKIPIQKNKLRSLESKTKKIKNSKFFTERFIKQDSDEQIEAPPISLKDLTDADKLLPSFLNLSESDSSDDEQPSTSLKKKVVTNFEPTLEVYSENETDTKMEYQDVWSSNAVDQSEEIARKTFLELEQHKNKLEEAKISVQNYIAKCEEKESDVNDLLALGEEEIEKPPEAKFKKKKVINKDSDSEPEDWEEVNESKAIIPQQGLQLFVDIPGAVKRKTKTLDVEMMLKRKMNRVKKQYQVYMHKVHVLCWLGHGNYVSQVLNDQEILSAALSLVPSKECYPGQRVDMKYVEQITLWYKDKVNIQQDKNENKFRPKAPPLKDILIKEMKKRIFSTKKYMVYVFVSMLRSLGLQSRIMFNFVTLPIRPLASELCSLSIKDKDDKSKVTNEAEKTKSKSIKGKNKQITKQDVIPQLDGNFDIFDSENENIMQVDGGDDSLSVRTRSHKKLSLKKENKEDADDKAKDANKKVDSVSLSNNSKINLSFTKTMEANKPTSPMQKIKETNADKKIESVKDIVNNDNKEKDSVLPPKRLRRNLSLQTKNTETSKSNNPEQKKKENNANNKSDENYVKNTDDNRVKGDVLPPKRSKRNLSLQTQKSGTSDKTDNALDYKEDVKSPIRSKRYLSQQTNKAEVSKLKNKLNEKKEAVVNIKSRGSKNITSNTNKIENNISPKRSKKNLNSATKNNESSQSLKEDTKLEGKEEVTNIIEKTRNTLNRSKNKKERENTRGATEEKNVYEEECLTKSRTSKCSAGRGQLKLNLQSLLKDEYDKSMTTTRVSELVSRNIPKVILTDINNETVASKFFENSPIKQSTSRKRSQTTEPKKLTKENPKNASKTRTSGARTPTESKYFTSDSYHNPVKRSRTIKKQDNSEDENRVSHRDLAKKKPTAKPKNDVTNDLVHIIKERVKEAKADAKKLIVKDKQKKDSDADSDYLAVESPAPRKSDTDEDFKPDKITPKQKKSVKKIDRRVLSTDDDLPLNKINVWCEIFVEELEEWVSVDIVKGKVHCANEIYSRASHPVTYVVGWDNNNYLKDLTRRYVPHWNTVTRKQRVQPLWWDEALKPWLGPKSARDREEDERLDRMQLEAPLPKVISEYKNHPLYVLKRHLLKFEVIYPPDAPTLGFVRSEPVYSRDCVYICKSRDVWIKEAKVVKLGEEPYKIVKARPKYIRATNTFITDLPLEVFGPWQIQDYEPPKAENGIVPRNAYGNVELFKKCMLPKGTVHMKLPSLQRIAKKLNIDCAPALTGFDCNGGWTHPVYDGVVVCEEFEKVLTEAWLKDQEEQERKEQDKIETRVYGNWRRLIRGLLIKERLKAKYGFSEPSTSQQQKKNKGPKFVVKKK